MHNGFMYSLFALKYAGHEQRKLSNQLKQKNHSKCFGEFKPDHSKLLLVLKFTLQLSLSRVY